MIGVVLYLINLNTSFKILNIDMSKKQTVRESTKNGIRTRKTVTVTKKRVRKNKK